MNEFDDVPIKQFKSKKRCSVMGCSSRADAETSLHHFPKNEELHHMWVQISKLKNRVSAHSLVCSKHFLEEDYREPGKDDDGRRRFLKRDAVPSQNLPLSSPKSAVKAKPSLEPKPKTVKPLPNKIIKQEILNIISSDSDSDDFGSSKIPNHIYFQDFVSVELGKGCADDDPLTFCAVGDNSSRDQGIQVNSFEKKGVWRFIQNATTLQSWTSMVSFSMLHTVEKCLKDASIQTPPRIDTTLSHQEQILLVFIKLKTSLSFTNLASLFDIPSNAVDPVLLTVLPALRKAFSNTEWRRTFEADKGGPVCELLYRDGDK